MIVDDQMFRFELDAQRLSIQHQRAHCESPCIGRNGQAPLRLYRRKVYQNQWRQGRLGISADIRPPRPRICVNAGAGRDGAVQSIVKEQEMEWPFAKAP